MQISASEFLGFKAKTLTTRFLVREMLFADGSLLVVHFAEDMLRSDCREWLPTPYSPIRYTQI